MNRFLKYTLGAAVIAGTAAFAAAPASAQVSVGIGFGPGFSSGYGYAPRGLVCDPYSRFYNAFACVRPYNYYAPSYYGGGPVLSFGFNSGFNRGFNNHRGRNDWHTNGGGRNGRR